MARKSTKKTGKTEATTPVEEPIPSEASSEMPEETVELAEELLAGKDETMSEVEDADVITDEPSPVTEIEEEFSEPEPESAEAEPEEVSKTAPAAPAQGGSGFLPMLLGGLVAGGIGYGISYLQWSGENDLATQIQSQNTALSDLQAQIESLPPPVDISPLSDQIAELSDGLSSVGGRIDEVADQLETTGEKVAALERRPNADGTLADTALAAFEAEIQGLREQLSAQESELQSMANTAAEQLQATREEAIAIEENAVATARRATARTVLAQVQSAMETGAPLGALLSDLGQSLDNPLPDALNAVADGVPTLSDLQATFPEQARAALSVARAEGVSGEASSGLGSFLRNQFDVRSVAPQEGDTVDAILSRAEANVRSGQLSSALAEIASLPEVVRASMSEWVAQAELRAAALDAVAQLSDTLNIN